VLSGNIRKWFSLIVAVALYYIIHEGAHLVVALLFGTFQSIRLVKWGLGVQIVADTALMSGGQIFVFCIMGIAATLIAGYIMVWQRKNILKSKSLVLRAIAYYATLIFLCLDPFYLSVLSHFVGGGDLNGIVLAGVPRTVAVIFFLLLFALNLFLFAKQVYPLYKRKFLEER
jgi:hypothetical protein